MTIQNKTIIEIERDIRKYQLHMNPESTLGEIFDVLIEMQKIISDKIKESIQNLEQHSGEQT